MRTIRHYVFIHCGIRTFNIAPMIDDVTEAVRNKNRMCAEWRKGRSEESWKGTRKVATCKESYILS